MVVVEVNEQKVFVEPDETSVNVTIAQAPVYVEVGPSVVNVASTQIGNRVRVAGSAFSGIIDGGTDRAYTFPVALGTKQIVAVGTATGALTIIDPTGGYTLSTVTLTNDTMTIHLPLFNSDVVMVWY